MGKLPLCILCAARKAVHGFAHSKALFFGSRLTYPICRISLADVQRPVFSSISNTTPQNSVSPAASSKRTGIWVKNFSRIHSFFTPKIESFAPTMPTSVTKPVPADSTHASLVCTCVCVPNTALTRPIKIFGKRGLLGGGFGVKVKDSRVIQTVVLH